MFLIVLVQYQLQVSFQYQLGVDETYYRGGNFEVVQSWTARTTPTHTPLLYLQHFLACLHGSEMSSIARVDWHAHVCYVRVEVVTTSTA